MLAADSPCDHVGLRPTEACRAVAHASSGAQGRRPPERDDGAGRRDAVFGSRAVSRRPRRTHGREASAREQQGRARARAFRSVPSMCCVVVPICRQVTTVQTYDRRRRSRPAVDGRAPVLQNRRALSPAGACWQAPCRARRRMVVAVAPDCARRKTRCSCSATTRRARAASGARTRCCSADYRKLPRRRPRVAPLLSACACAGWRAAAVLARQRLVQRPVRSPPAYGARGRGESPSRPSLPCAAS